MNDSRHEGWDRAVSRPREEVSRPSDRQVWTGDQFGGPGPRAAVNWVPGWEGEREAVSAAQTTPALTGNGRRTHRGSWAGAAFEVGGNHGGKSPSSEQRGVWRQPR